MLLDAIIVLASIIFSFIGLFLPPVVAFTVETTNSIIQAGNIVYMVNQFIDVTTLFFAIGVVVTFEITMLGLQLARWAIRSMPFLNSRV